MLRLLVTATTYRRAVFLLLGGVLALPYMLGAGLMAGLLTGNDPNRAGTLATIAVAMLIAIVPPFLGGTRELEIAAARALLGVDLPAHDRRRRLETETRLRAALWFALHLVTGALTGAVILIVVPVAVLACTERMGLTRGAMEDVDLGSLGAISGWWWVLAGALLTVGTIYGAAGLGRLAATMAPVLLGPSAGERERHLAERERQLAERNRLARELHDSVGHALTAMTLQAGAARAVFDSDPAFARRAVEAIEETGRAAAGELDAVLGILRDEAADQHATPTLADLDRLLTGQVEADIAEVDVPPRVSREAYRIVQESLTNAARHGSGPVTLRIHQEEDLVIEVTNPRAARKARPGGHGIEGMRERVQLLGGSLRAGPDGENWLLLVRLPK
jgi:signal transduction histidine kinase